MLKTEKQTLISLIFLVGGFLALVAGFSSVDLYHKHFFDHGSVFLFYNASRIVFAFFLMWIIYAVGYAILFIATPTRTLQEFTSMERFIFGFGTGIGFWHGLLLACGVLNLYYQSVMVVLCLIVLCASAKHFKTVISQTRQSITKEAAVIYMLIGLALVWLLFVRGLYPGGGGDYYTHYFYYYLEVLQNHGLVPNDVWYHYYYTKGSGLDFLGMLVMDPESPEVVTFCYVTLAAFALATFSARLVPRSLWPAFSAILYILFNMVSVSGNGGEFQKLHEKNSALIVMAMWAICMYSSRPQWERPALITLVSVMIAASIFMQPTALFFVVFFGIWTVLSYFKKNYKQMRHALFLGAVTAGALVCVLFLNYCMTGLVTDQAINLTWRFANVERLNQWGVIPNILMVVWARESYAHMVVPYGWNTIGQLSTFMRVDRLWILLESAFIPLLLFYFKFPRQVFLEKKEEIRMAQTAWVNVSLLIAVFAVLSIFVGHIQSVSYLRFSSFFFPLLILWSVICWALLVSKWHTFSYSKILRIEIPMILLIMVLTTWSHWFLDVREVTKHAMRFIRGKYSFADAYSHQFGGVWFGAINPAALEAMRQTSPGTRIWSMNGNAHCSAVPGCRVESVISFKLSSHLEKILNGTPEEAKKILQNENLNYFLYANNYVLLDLLAYSPLFNPKTLNKYFSIKWTDGNTYLLTWRQPYLMAIGPDFVKAYSDSIKQPRVNWFDFKESLPEIDRFMKKLTQSSHPWHPIAFPPAPEEIR